MAATRPPGLATLRASATALCLTHALAGRLFAGAIMVWVVCITFLEGRIMSQRALANISCTAIEPANGGSVCLDCM